MSQTATPDFVLPNPSNGRFVAMALITSQMLACFYTVATLVPEQSAWMHFIATTVFVHWVVLSNVIFLIGSRPMWKPLPPNQAAALLWFGFVAVTAIVSLISLNFLTGHKDLEPASHGLFITRNCVLAAMISAMVLRYFFIRTRERGRGKRELQARMQALQSRIRPHFFFNSMNTIAALTASRPEAAEEAVENLSALFRASLSDARNLVTVREEIEIAQRYQAIEQLRMGDRLDVRWNVDKLPMQARIPTLTLQPLLENAIYHGVEPLPDGGTVEIVGRFTDEHLIFEINNPMAPTKRTTNGRKGHQIALDNIKERLDLVFGDSARLDQAPGEGSYQVMVRIPNTNM